MFFGKKSQHHLADVSRILRLAILDTAYKSGAAHIGGTLSVLDSILALYNSPDLNFHKDHFVLSAGHYCLAHYAVLCHQNKVSFNKLNTFSSLGSVYQGHESIHVPGVEFSSGSLGQGLSFACGLALGDKERHTVCITSDAEHNEGQIWESLLFANKYHLGNLINVVDYNSIQIDGTTDEIMPLGELAAKYLRFGWTVTTVDGHDFFALEKAIHTAFSSSIYPACIIAKTTFGKGISYMENNPSYHHIKNLSEELYNTAKQELEIKNENDKR